MIDNIELNQPIWLWVILILPILFMLIRQYSNIDTGSSLIDGLSGSSTRVRHPLYKLLVPTKNKKSFNSYSKTIFYWLLLSLLMLALAGPVQIGSKLPDPPRQRDIIFIVDTSVSMILKDYILNDKRIDRMNVIRSTLNNFIKNLKGDRVSIIAFADTAHVLVPLTNDTYLLQSMLLRLRPGIAGRSSAPGDAVALAVKQIRKKADRHQIMVLLTDAALPVGSITPIQAANIAADAKLPLYTVAVGANTYDAEEQRTTGLVYHPADRELLKKMASITGAESYLAGDSQSLQSAIANIEKQKTNQQKIEDRFYRKSLHQWPLLLALMLLSLYQLRAVTQKGLS
ncbi:MAG: VWA domain-containing protein [Sulfuriflexus sp.]|nr:VWA domain-containing protein [Sulfuriflexus sp.]